MPRRLLLQNHPDFGRLPFRSAPAGGILVTKTEPTSPDTAPAVRVGHYRWVICALIFFATTVNYIDRQVLGILAPDLQRIIGWNEKEYGFIVTAFQAAYFASLLLTGWLID